MPEREPDAIREFWDRVAEGWDQQVGVDGDTNRILNSDPVLWAMAGDVRGLRVLDAGCGTGYLTAHLHARGATAIGVDLSARMIDIARARHPRIEFRVDSVSELRTAANADFDLIVANYVLMDTPDLDGTLRAFARAGFRVTDFDEPRVQPERYHLAPSEKKLSASRHRPYSVAFQLERA
jgi:2-polyprenyl-3-methyl-5-hydroxy-6-metoxy-1,4-benzoquinol methylase